MVLVYIAWRVMGDTSKKMWISNLTYIIGKQDPSKTLRVCLAIAERTNLASAHLLHPLLSPSEVIYISVLGGRIMAAVPIY